MMYLAIERVLDEWALRLTTDQTGWTCRLDEHTDVADLLRPTRHFRGPRANPVDDGVHFDELIGLPSFFIGKHHSELRVGGRRVEVQGVALRHRVELRPGQSSLTHSLALVAADGEVHALARKDRTCPVIANAIGQWASLPIEREVVVVTERGDERLSAAAHAVLAGFFAMTNAERRARDVQLRAAHAHRTDVDVGRELVESLTARLERYAPLVAHRPAAVEAVLSHTIGTATLAVTWGADPAQLTLSATLPPAAMAPLTSTALTLSRVDGLFDMVRNINDVKSGHADVDAAFVIKGDAAGAAAVAALVGDALAALLGRSVTLSLDDSSLRITVVSRVTGASANAGVAADLASIWEALLVR